MNILKILTPQRLIGNLGERQAVRFLRKRGYRILRRNYEARNAEIDIIARNKDTTAFIEVKTRSIESLGSKQSRPGSAVTAEKQRKIITAAKHYINHNPSATRFRFDVIEVYVENGGSKPRVKEIKHLEGAFNMNTAYDASYAYTRKKEGSNL